MTKVRSQARRFVVREIFVLAAGAACGGGFFLLAGCGNNSKPSTTGCVTERCAVGNLCVDGQCSLPCARHSDCPEDQGFRCATGVADDGSGERLVCRPGAIATSPNGYGASCGLHLDGDCDSTQGFICPGRQNDVDAFCTKLDGCTSDADCPSTMYCGSLARRGCVSLSNCSTQAECDRFPGFSCVDDGSGRKSCTREQSCHTQPDDCELGFACQSLAGDSTRLKLARACVPRRDCAPCQADRDCAEPNSACVPDQNGEGFCSRPCAGGNSCDTGSSCMTLARGDFCFPRGGSCHGDGSACSACRDSGDCGPRGRCQLIEETRERFCIEPCQDGACPSAPGGGTMTCCTDPTLCQGALNTCLPDAADNPYPRWSSGCWLATCQVNGDCPAGELCDVRLRSQPSAAEQVTQCGTRGVCRPPHDPTDVVDFQVFHLVCDCAGKGYASEAELALDGAVAFKGCCKTFTSGGTTYTCATP